MDVEKKSGPLSKYKPEYCEKLITHMKKGLSFESFAADVNCHRDTLYEWAKVHPSFSDAKKQGTAECLKFWETLYINVAAGKIKGASASLIIFKMKCSFGYKDGTEVNAQSDVRDDSNKVWVTRWRNKPNKDETKAKEKK